MHDRGARSRRTNRALGDFRRRYRQVPRYGRDVDRACYRTADYYLSATSHESCHSGVLTGRLDRQELWLQYVTSRTWLCKPAKIRSRDTRAILRCDTPQPLND